MEGSHSHRHAVRFGFAGVSPKIRANATVTDKTKSDYRNGRAGKQAIHNYLP